MATAPHRIERRPEDVPAERKAELLRELDERGRGAGGEIAQLLASYAEARREVTVANSEGLLSGDDRTRTRLAAQVVARRGDRVETGAETLGAQRGFELFDDDPAEIAASAAGKALTLLGARPAPTGSMPVVVGGGFGGVLFHEMTGHGLEADHIQKGASVYEGKLGKRVAQPLLSAYDDGQMPNEWGSDAIDDEGTPTQKTLAIEEGKLTAYLYDRLRAERDGVASTGNGRRQSFRHLPIPRMTNTYIAPGDAEPGAIIGEVDQGFYAVSFAGGQVDPATGDFVFGVSEGYLIEGGKVTSPCRGATLIGNCLQALESIDAVGNDFWMKTGICGKGGQSVPVGHRPGTRPDRRDDGRRDRNMTELDPAAVAARAVEEAVAAGADDAEASPPRSPRARSVSTAARSKASPPRPGAASGSGLGSAAASATATAPTSPMTGSGRSAPALPRPLPRPTRTSSPGHRRLRTPRRRWTGSCDPSVAEWRTERTAQLALAVEEAALASDPRVVGVEQAVYADAVERVAISSSTGTGGEFEASSCYAYLQALAEGDDGRETGLGFGLARGPGGLDPAAIGREGAERATAMIGAGKPESRSCPVVLDPTVAASFVGLLGSAIGADAVQRGRSPLAGRVGEEVAGEAFVLHDDGLDPEGSPPPRSMARACPGAEPR